MNQVSVRNDIKLSTLRPCASCRGQGRSKDCGICAAASPKMVADWIRTKRRVELVMARTNSLVRAERVLARMLQSGRTMVESAVETMPGVQSLKEARLAMEVVSSVELTPNINTFGLTLAPELSGGRWVTRGRMRRGLKPILGVKELLILLPSQRLAELIMLQAHYAAHEGTEGTLARSRGRAWICGGGKLAKRIANECVHCKKEAAKLVEQRTGQLPMERMAVGSPPWAGVCLDLMGPVLVRGMVNKRSSMKAWPLLFVCQGTGALHICLMHDYGTEAFLLQYRSFVSLRGKPAKVTSDQGSQLTSKGNVVVTAAEHPTSWGWQEVADRTAQEGTVWEFVPAGCQYRNGLAENRVKVVKKTLAIMIDRTVDQKALTYAEMEVLLQEAANVVNDRPVGLRGLKDGVLSPLTANQLLLGRNSNQECSYDETGELKSGSDLSTYSQDLLRMWWKAWKEQSLGRLLPYCSKAAATPKQDLAPGDVCQLLYKTKVTSHYRLCLVKSVTKSKDGLVRTVKVVLRNRRDGQDVVNKHLEPVEIEVGVQRLCLILPVSDQTKSQRRLLDGLSK